MPNRPALLSALLASSVLVVGCGTAGGGSAGGGSAGGGSAGGGSADSGLAAGGPVATERLTIALAKDSGPLNIFADQSPAIDELVYDKLLAPSPYVDQPRPWLATAVRQLDPSTWEADLRDDVRWQDGERFDAEDVAFSFDYFKKAPTGTYTHHVSDVPTIETITALTPTKVRFACAFPCPELGTVTLADLPVIAEHIWAGVPPDKAKQVTSLPVGTGPYRLVSYDSTAGYRFEANPDYFAGAPVVQELVMPVISDASATFTALRSGEVDATTRPLSPELIDPFTSSNDVGVVRTAPLRFPELRINYDRAPFDQPAFRAALSRAIDRDQLLAVVGLGKGRAAVTGYPHPDAPFANPALSTPYDPEQARVMLDQLGLVDRDGDGTREGPAGPLAFTILANGAASQDVRFAELIAEDLREVGLGATARGLDAGSVADVAKTRDFDLVIAAIGPHGAADPTQFIMSHRSGYLWRAPKLPYPEWDELFANWKATTTVEDRLAVLDQMQVLFNRQPTSIPLYYPDEYWAFRADRFAGWVESPGYGIVHKWSLLAPQVGRNAGAVVGVGR